LHNTQYNKKGKREEYSKGNVKEIRKGKLIGLSNGKVGRLCGSTGNYFYIHNREKKRESGKEIKFISKNFIIKGKAWILGY
jgi:hypothetical protein